MDDDLYADRLALNSEEYRAMIRLANDKVDPDQPKRGASRHPWTNPPRIRAELTSPAGEVMRTIVYPVDISQSGARLLHGRYEYSGTSLKLLDALPDADEPTLEATVVRCRLITGKLHEIGIEFKNPAGTLDAASLSEQPDAGAFESDATPATAATSRIHESALQIALGALSEAVTAREAILTMMKAAEEEHAKDAVVE